MKFTLVTLFTCIASFNTGKLIIGTTASEDEMRREDTCLAEVFLSNPVCSKPDNTTIINCRFLNCIEEAVKKCVEKIDTKEQIYQLLEIDEKMNRLNCSRGQDQSITSGFWKLTTGNIILALIIIVFISLFRS